MDIVLLLSAHCIGGFYCQWEPAQAKHTQGLLGALARGGLYIAPFILLFTRPSHPAAALPWLAILFAGSFAIRLLQLLVNRKFKKEKQIWFFAGQILQIAIILLIGGRLSPADTMGALALAALSSLTGIAALKCGLFLLGMLLLGKPLAAVNGFILNRYPAAGDTDAGRAVARAGYMIGILERTIVLALWLSGQIGAIGLVFTAKSIARYKQLEDQAFAEKYLIGTLLSVLEAIAISYLIQIL